MSSSSGKWAFYQFLSALLAVSLVSHTSSMEMNCQNDYSPCSCNTFQLDHLPAQEVDLMTDVSCNQLGLHQVKDVFSKRENQQDLYEMEMVFLPTEQLLLPANFLGLNRARRIRLMCLRGAKQQLQIDADAFRASENYTREIFLQNCELSRLEFDFLDRFTALSELYIRSSVIPVIHGLPPSVPLRLLDIYHCDAFEWNVESLSPELTVLRLDGNHLDDQTAERVIKSVVASPDNSLTDLVLSGNHLTRIPKDITLLNDKFSRLKLKGNPIPQIGASSFEYRNPNHKFAVLNLSKMSLKVIEPGTFQGASFEDSFIHLNDNDLTEVSSAVFKPVLEAMHRSNGSSFHETRIQRGAIFLDSNPLECDCGISWLVRDNRHLMAHVRGAACANSTRLEQLDPYGFNHCPLIEKLSEENPLAATDEPRT